MSPQTEDWHRTLDRAERTARAMCGEGFLKRYPPEVVRLVADVLRLSETFGAKEPQL